MPAWVVNIVGWYEARWGIEEYFRLLKQGTRIEYRRPRERGQAPPPDIRSWVVWLGRMAGFRPSQRRPLPGNEVLWRAFATLQTMV